MANTKRQEMNGASPENATITAPENEAELPLAAVPIVGDAAPKANHDVSLERLSILTASPVPECYPHGLLPRSRELFAKEWDVKFLKYQKINEDQSFVSTRRKLFSEDREDDANQTSEQEGTKAIEKKILNGDGIRIFLNDFDEPMGLVQGDEVEDFCQDASLEDLISGTGDGDAGVRRAAWIDDRQFSEDKKGGNVREHKNPLTATSLYRDLVKSV
jgi:hypothetical protein